MVSQRSANCLNPESLLWSVHPFLVDIKYKILCILQPGGISPWLTETIQTFCYAFNLKLLRHEAAAIISFSHKVKNVSDQAPWP